MANDADDQRPKIIVCGAGIMGLTTCYYLSLSKKYRVICVEKFQGPSLLCSYENGAFLDPSVYTSWSSISLFKRGLVGLWDDPLNRSAIHVHWNIFRDWAFFKWAYYFLQNSLPSTSNPNGRKIRELGYYSMTKMQSFYKDHPQFVSDKIFHAKGTLEIFPSSQIFQSAQTSDRLKHHKELQYPFRAYDYIPAQMQYLCHQDFVLLSRNSLENGMIENQRGTNGDIYQTSLHLEQICRENGVEFLYNREIAHFKLSRDQTQVNAVVLKSGETLAADKFILATGNASRKLCQDVGITSLHMYPVKGYLLTFPINKKYPMLRCNIYGGGNVLISPFASVLRLSGCADFEDYHLEQEKREMDHPSEHDLQRAQWLIDQARRILPQDYFDASQMQLHTCYRSISCDDVPYIGPTKIENLYVNTGHGSKGWTLSFGSSALLAALILHNSYTALNPQLESTIDIRGYSAQRYERWFT